MSNQPKHYLLIRVDSSILSKIDCEPIAIFYNQEFARECMERESLCNEEQGINYFVVETRYP